MAVFFDPNHLFEETYSGGTGLFGSPRWTIFTPVGSTQPLQQIASPQVLTGTTKVYSSTLSGGDISGSDEIAEIWGQGTLFFGGDTVETTFTATGGNLINSAAQAAKTPVGLLFIIAALIWFFYARKKRG